MAQFALTLTRRWAGAPLPLRIALVYLAARAVTTALMIAAAVQSTSLSRFGADPGLADFIVAWDAQWYWLVAEEGYPSDLPLTESGEVAENAWAFMPVFSFIAARAWFSASTPRPPETRPWPTSRLSPSTRTAPTSSLALFNPSTPMLLPHPPPSPLLVVETALSPPLQEPLVVLSQPQPLSLVLVRTAKVRPAPAAASAA